MLQLSFISKIKENTSSRHEGMLTQKTQRERERERERMRERVCAQERPPALWPLGPSFCLFFPPPGLPCVNWASQECSLFYLRSSLPSSDLPLFYFHGLFPFLGFWPLPLWTPFSYSNYLTRPFSSIPLIVEI